MACLWIQSYLVAESELSFPNFLQSKISSSIFQSESNPLLDSQHLRCSPCSAFSEHPRSGTCPGLCQARKLNSTSLQELQRGRSSSWENKSSSLFPPERRQQAYTAILKGGYSFVVCVCFGKNRSPLEIKKLFWELEGIIKQYRNRSLNYCKNHTGSTKTIPPSSLGSPPPPPASHTKLGYEKQSFQGNWRSPCCPDVGEWAINQRAKPFVF